jgi:hypothetical protein
MRHAFPVYRVCTSTCLGRAKYRRSEDLSISMPLNLIPASVTVSKDWVIIVVTTELAEQPIG